MSEPRLPNPQFVAPLYLFAHRTSPSLGEPDRRLYEGRLSG